MAAIDNLNRARQWRPSVPSWPSPRRLVPFAPLLIPAVAGFLLRWWVIAVSRPQCDGIQLATAPNTCFRLVGDMMYFRNQGHYLAKGHGFLNATALTVGKVRPGAYHPPLFPTVLAVFNRLGIRSVEAQRLGLSLIGALTIVLVGVVAWKLAGRFGRVAGLAAATIAALHPLVWLNETQAMSEAVYVPLVVGLIAACYRLWLRPTWGSAALVGLLVGLVGLTRAESLAMGLFLVPVLWGLHALPRRFRLKLLAVAAVTALVVMAPWVAYNVSRFPNTTFVTTSAGDALAFRSCDSTFYGRSLGYYDTANCAPKPSFASEDESKQDLHARALALDYIGSHLDRLPVVVAARVGRTWEIYRPIQNAELSGFLDNRGVTEAKLGLLGYYLVIGPAVYGAVRLRRRGTPISPLVGMFVLASVSSALTSAVVRYRVGADVAAVILAGVGIAELWVRHLQRRLGWRWERWQQRWAQPRGRRPLARAPVMMCVALLLAAPVPTAGPPPTRGTAPAVPSGPATPGSRAKPKGCELSDSLVRLYDAYDASMAEESAARLRAWAPPRVQARVDQVVATDGDIVALDPTALMATTKELAAFASDRCSLFGTAAGR